MKNNQSLVLSISNLKDIRKINKATKYINIDIANCDYDVIKYFMEHGKGFMYSDIIGNHYGYNYVDYENFLKAENLIDMIYTNMPNNLNELETSKYLYVSLAHCISFDINADETKNELYNLPLISSTHNLWSSLANGIVTEISASKIYYYLLKRLGIDAEITTGDDKKYLTKLKIDNQIVLTNLFLDIPYIQCHMQTRYFGAYNDDRELDKKIKYLKTKYNDYYLDKVLKDIDYTKENCVWTILTETEDILNINTLNPTILNAIYSYLFSKYCPHYDIKINNLYLNNYLKKHFIIISYNNHHYSYNYKKKTFVSISETEIADNLNLKKIALYQNEYIPNINLELNL